MGSNLTPEQKNDILEILLEFKTIFSDPRPGNVPPEVAELKIKLKEDKHVYIPPYKLGPKESEFMKKSLQSWLATGMVRPSTSSFSSPGFPVAKKDEEGRLVESRAVLDYRALNNNTERDRYPIPNTETLLNQLTDGKFFSKLDLRSGYWQISIAEEDRHKTAFSFGDGLFEWNVVPFGLTNAPPCFQRGLDGLLKEAIRRGFARPFYDDTPIYSRTWKDHLGHLRFVLFAFAKAGLKVNHKKCVFGVVEFLFLGYVVRQGALALDPMKVNAVAKWPRPSSPHEIQQFMGLCGFYRKFVKGFAVAAAPLTYLTSPGVPFHWSNDQEKAFEYLKTALTSYPVLHLPDFNLKFWLETDACSVGLGGVLTQRKEEGQVVCAYVSKKFSIQEQKYSVRELEALAIVHCIKRLRCFLLGQKFTVLTDHASLQWMKDWREAPPRVKRWLLQLQEYDFKIRYRQGSENIVADALSRNAINNVLCAIIRATDRHAQPENPFDFASHFAPPQ